MQSIQKQINKNTASLNSLKCKISIYRSYFRSNLWKAIKYLYKYRLFNNNSIKSAPKTNKFLDL